ncbi:MAG: 50S ribosomal protein L10 [Candidatus Yanofskybacteria bacterium RIFCSPLOWO2_02_FULL_47_9b]|uniref:Large ribosomal subunit protein uL10 n=1 Tax=Candidatus Yanofskybacteria bacterium RIFCSPLOWO2_02_FULL_47_9b TaxID=1802708 RepID=A0A1F8HAE2_9BACT|nr:MAG: 50S ribosomal protein L10 [Candidatus Yanofskybacteria bacterium RIFCSPLOWO2_02_FULL_47_9b]
MPKTKTQKQNILLQIADNLKRQKSLLFVDYKGIGVKDLSQLRKQLKAAGAKFEVAKKTLLKKAFAEQGLKTDFKEMKGQIAVVYSFDDPMAGVKTAHTFAKGREDMKMLGGYMENRLLNEDEVKELALLPSREQLLGMFVATLAAPMQSFARVLQGNIKGLVVALSAIKK